MWVVKKKIKEIKCRLNRIEKEMVDFQRKAKPKEKDITEKYKLKHRITRNEAISNENGQSNTKIMSGRMKKRTLAVMLEPGEIYYVAVALDDVEIPSSIFRMMEMVPKFDIINECCRAKYLLEYLRKTNQKITIIASPCGKREKIMERIKSSQWKDVFLP